MKEIREVASALLSGGQVDWVLGYEEDAKGLVKPAFITDPAQAARLIFDPRCVHNLAVYLLPGRRHVRALGRGALVVKACDARAVAGLLREHQLQRDELVLIGVRCGGVRQDPGPDAVLNEESVAARCALCPERTPQRVDHLVGPELPPPPAGNRDLLREIAELEALTSEARFAFWSKHFSRCVRCHACRQVCPLCNCTRCIADKSQPQFIEAAPHLRGNLAWNITRALHLAGRCVGCGECERACPVDIPLALINAKLSHFMHERYAHEASEDPEQPSPIGDFRSDDDQEFIR